MFGVAEVRSDGTVATPRHHDRWLGAHLVQGCRRLTSGFSFRRSAEMRVSRVFFSGPYQRCVRMRVQGVRDEMWLVSCGFEPAGTSMSSPEAVLRVHA